MCSNWKYYTFDRFTDLGMNSKEVCSEVFQINLTRCTILLSIFISLLYMFRATMCPSSEEIIVYMRQSCVTLWVVSGLLFGVLLRYLSFFWIQLCPTWGLMKTTYRLGSKIAQWLFGNDHYFLQLFSPISIPDFHAPETHWCQIYYLSIQQQLPFFHCENV